jgi:hypothetical protein
MLRPSPMNGARRHDTPCADPWPVAAVIHALHDRYLTEVVEHLGLCPFARRSREQGRVHRPLWWVDGALDPAAVARTLLAVVRESPDAEILLPTFVVPPDHPWNDAETFATFVPELRAAYEQTDGPRFFMVAFHPGFAADAGAKRRLSPDSLVPRLRRTPDPVIQCVHAEVLEKARRAAQATARDRLRERFDHDPVMAALIERSVQADPELSAEIARNNFAAVGDGTGAEELQRRISAIAAARAAVGVRPHVPR